MELENIKFYYEKIISKIVIVKDDEFVFMK